MNSCLYLRELSWSGKSASTLSSATTWKRTYGMICPSSTTQGQRPVLASWKELSTYSVPARAFTWKNSIQRTGKRCGRRSIHLKSFGNYVSTLVWFLCLRRATRFSSLLVSRFNLNTSKTFSFSTLKQKKFKNCGKVGVSNSTFPGTNVL